MNVSKNRSHQFRFKLIGFTLVELLVVISIISMLMAILIPALGRAREQGQRAHCLNNIRQLTVAWMIYAENNDDKLCSPHTGWIDEDFGLLHGRYYGLPHWVLGGPSAPPWYNSNHIGDSEIAIKEGVLWPYTQTVELYRCRTDRSGRLRSYSMSNTMGGKPSDLDLKEWQFRTLNEISRPSERLVFACVYSGKRWIAGSFFPISYVNSEVQQWGNYMNNEWPEAQIITARHGGGCNISLADGHCEWWKYKDQRTVKLANLQLGLGDPVHKDNADLERMVELLKGHK